ncbi:acyltransferase [Amycolatopsis sp. K13G38]|uniref:Acyltransferase n=1 Tax=Amycolatopsis acididurans TaxID=2724524 RepID=A0ABX1J9K0_9PSEU|nr:acyltransferase family protein [Amycolatopsis acididurans]NKQ55976.1 acyltransferase [Amycolatopsis acididurans]
MSESSGRTRRTFRPELQGLRALACALVVVYHVWLGRISGGVDVFFVITGFLITGQLVRARARGGIEFRAMWSRMIKRLFPPALTVLAVVIALSVLVLPQARWWQTIREVVASALYFENWRLAADSADYFAQHNEASPVQHFWSLAIQGQFYLVWPLLVALVAALARRHVRGVLAAVLVAIFAASLAFSVWLTWADQPLAYFHSLTRVWEFALGGLLALVIDALVLPRLLRIILGWAGVAGLVSCGLLFAVGTEFPGYVALWPTLSAALVLVAGATASPVGADRMLSSRPLRYLGDLSYALYLWHWPVLVFYLVARGRAEVGPLGGAAVAGTSLLLAIATYHLVEKPVRDSRIGVRTRWGAYRFAVLAMAPVLVATGAWQLTADQLARSRSVTAGDLDHPGALAMTPGFVYQGAEHPALAPSFISVAEDWAWIDSCEDSPRGYELQVCSTSTEEPPAKRVAIVGDSHPTQFIAALLPIARQRNWQLIVLSRGGCPFSVESEIDPDNQACRDWNAAAADEILDLRPDAVLTTATRDVRLGLTEQTPPGFVAQWQKLDAASIPVLAVRDNPRYDGSPSACVEQLGPDAADCSAPRTELYAPEPPYRSLTGVPPNVSFLDFGDYYCDPEVCPAVIGNVLLYLDDNHLTAAYLSTMAPIVADAIETALGWAGTDEPAPA